MTAGEATRPVPRGAGISYYRVSRLIRKMRSRNSRRVATYSDGDGTTLGALLNGQRVRLTEVGTPVTATDGENAQLGDGDGGTDGGSDFLGGLDTETDVALGVTDDNDSLEAGTLTGTGLLLDGLDL